MNCDCDQLRNKISLLEKDHHLQMNLLRERLEQQYEYMVKIQQEGHENIHSIQDQEIQQLKFLL